MHTLFGIAVGIICAIMVPVYAYKKGYTWAVWVLPGFGVIGMLLMPWLLPDLRESGWEEEKKRRVRRCVDGLGILLSVVFIACLIAFFTVHSEKVRSPMLQVESLGVYSVMPEGAPEARAVFQSRDFDRLHPYYIGPQAEITEADIKRVRRAKDAWDQPCLEVQLTKEGSMKLERLTTGAQRQTIVIMVNGAVNSAPVVQRPVTDGRFEIYARE